MKNEQWSVIVRECDGEHEHDLHFIAPKGMSKNHAIRIVDQCVREVKRKHYHDYQFSDIEEALAKHRFVAPLYATANEVW